MSSVGTEQFYPDNRVLKQYACGQCLELMLNS